MGKEKSGGILGKPAIRLLNTTGLRPSLSSWFFSAAVLW